MQAPQLSGDVTLLGMARGGLAWTLLTLWTPIIFLTPFSTVVPSIPPGLLHSIQHSLTSLQALMPSTCSASMMVMHARAKVLQNK